MGKIAIVEKVEHIGCMCGVCMSGKAKEKCPHCGKISGAPMKSHCRECGYPLNSQRIEGQPQAGV